MDQHPPVLVPPRAMSLSVKCTHDNGGHPWRGQKHRQVGLRIVGNWTLTERSIRSKGRSLHRPDLPRQPKGIALDPGFYDPPITDSHILHVRE